MKKLLYSVLLAAAGLGLAACEEVKDVYDMDMLDGINMVVRATSIADGTSTRPLDSITVDYNNLVGIDRSKSITLNGVAMDAKVNPENHMQLIIPLVTEWNKEYVLEIPGGMIYRSDDQSVAHGGLTIHFDTNLGIDKSKLDADLTNPKATSEAKALYAQMLEDYGTMMYSGAMGGVAWETSYSDFVAGNNSGAGYPKVVGFDYIHLASSPSNWIDYSDISPVQKVWSAGSIPAMTWHWNVPAGPMSNVLSEAVTEMPANWSGNIQIPASLFRFANVGTTVTIEISDVAADAQGSLKDGNWTGLVDEDGTSFEYFDLKDGNVNPNVTVSSSAITFKLSKALTAKVKEGGLIISGHDYTVNKVTFDSFIYDANNLDYNSATFSVTQALTPGTAENMVINADIEKLAGYLKLLQDAKIPVLFRPLHEAAGDYSWGAWFWWGREGVDATKQLWSYLRNKLEGEYGINNLIWVWTMQTSDAGQPASIETIRNAYPGDDLVDIVGTDLYPDFAMSDQTDQFTLINNVVQGKKIISLCEVGNLIDPAAAAESHCLWSYFMNWYDTDPNTGKSGFGNWNTESITIGDTYYPNVWSAVANSPYVKNR